MAGNNRLSDYLYHKAGKLHLPLSGTFELTPVCNFQCRMCYVRKTREEVARHTRPSRTLEQWIGLAEEAKAQGMLFLLLTGGEPLIWSDFWILYERMVQMGLLVSINTNGSMIDEEAVERFRQYPPRQINITLYGSKDETYEKLCGVVGMFRRVDRAIRSLKDAGIHVKLNCSLTPYNCEDIDEIVSYAKSVGLTLDLTTYMFPPVRRDPSMLGTNERFSPEEAAFYQLKNYRLQRGEEAYRNYLVDIDKGLIPPPGLDESCVDPLDGKIRCRAGKSVFWVTWDGQLSPCGMMNEPLVDLENKAFTDAWDELEERCLNMKISGICDQCIDRSICHACPAISAAETGSWSGVPKYMCEMIREMQKIAKRELHEA